MLKRPNKFRNKIVTVDGFKFHSMREASRWKELCMLQSAGKITNLERQVPFQLDVNGQKIGKLILDFVYEENGEKVYEDLKSKATITPIFKWKAKHFRAQYGVEVRVSF